jgi:hypothetical protein
MANIDRRRDKISTVLSYENELLVGFCGDGFGQFAGANRDEPDVSAGGPAARGSGSR